MIFRLPLLSKLKENINLVWQENIFLNSNNIPTFLLFNNLSVNAGGKHIWHAY
jgi:hypothetical protein